MRVLFLVSFLFVGMHLNAQKKHTITQRNFNELKTDLAKAQKELDIAKEKLAYVQKNFKLIAQKKAAQLQKNTAVLINEDSVFEIIKRQNIVHFNIAEKRVEKRQREFDKINLKYTLTLKRDSIIQNKYSSGPVIHQGLYVSLNPEAILEIQQGAVGLGVGYWLFKRVELWGEASYLFKGFQAYDDNFKNLKGFRGIVSGKYFYKNQHHFFLGIEFRFKQYDYDDKTDFENIQRIDTLFKFQYRLQNTLFGGAVFFGKRFKLSKNGKFELEMLAGTGLKYRFVNYNNVPAGYSKINYLFERGPAHIFPVNYEYTEQWVPYFPCAVRFVYHL